MKLSEMTTDRACDLLCEITPFIDNICNNEQFASLINEQFNANKTEEKPKTVANIVQKYTSKARVIVPVFLGDCRQDTFRLLAIVNEKTVDEIAKQNIMVTSKQIAELINDEVFVSFFMQYIQPAKTE